MSLQTHRKEAREEDPFIVVASTRKLCELRFAGEELFDRLKRRKAVDTRTLKLEPKFVTPRTHLLECVLRFMWV